jgi:hypothetical protein
LNPSITEQSYNNVFSVNISDIVCNRTTFSGVIVSVLASSGVDFWSSHGLVKPNPLKLVYAASPRTKKKQPTNQSNIP